jgi:ribosomal protein L24
LNTNAKRYNDKESLDVQFFASEILCVHEKFVIYGEQLQRKEVSKIPEAFKLSFQDNVAQNETCHKLFDGIMPNRYARHLYPKTFARHLYTFQYFMDFEDYTTTLFAPTIKGSLYDVVFICKGKYKGYTGVVTATSRRMYEVVVKETNMIRVKKSFCTFCHNDESNMNVNIDIAAYRCVQEIFKNGSPVDTRYCKKRFKASLERYFRILSPDVLVEGERERFSRAPPSDVSLILNARLDPL